MIKQGKRLFLMFILLLLVVALSACDSDEEESTPEPQTPAEFAEVMMGYVNEQDVDAASQYLCEQDIQTLLENRPTAATPKFSNISCVGNETIVTCTYNIEIDGRTAERDLTAEFDVSEDGKLCARAE